MWGLTFISHSQEEPDVKVLTGLFFTLVFFAATQGALCLSVRA